MAVAHRAPRLLVVGFDQVVDDLRIMGDLEDPAHDFEEFPERAFLRVENLDFVGDSAKERVVDEVFRFQVRAEDDELVEGDLHLLSTSHTDKVVPFFERNDPSVEEFVDAHPLATEVIDEEDSAIAFHLEGGVADVRFWVASHFEHRHRQLSPGDDGRAADADPSVVDLVVDQETVVRLMGDFLVVEGVEDAHYFPVDADASGDPDELAERFGDPFRDARLSVSGVAEEEHTSSGVDGGAESVEEFGGDQEVGERFLEVLLGWVLVFDRLKPNRLDVAR